MFSNTHRDSSICQTNIDHCIQPHQLKACDKISLPLQFVIEDVDDDVIRNGVVQPRGDTDLEASIIRPEQACARLLWGACWVWALVCCVLTCSTTAVSQSS